MSFPERRPSRLSPGRLFVAFAAASIAVSPAIAAAQPAQSGGGLRPFRGLFGPREADERKPPRLTLAMSAYGGTEDNSRVAPGGDVFDETLQARRPYQGAQATLGYQRARPGSVFRADAASAFRYFPTLHRIGTQKHSGAFSLDLTPSTQWKVQIAQAASYSPYYQLQLGRNGQGAAAPDLAAAGADFSVSREKQMGYDSFGGATYTVSRSAEMAVGYGLRYSHFFDSPDFRSQRANARYTHRLTPDFSLRLGYGLTSAVQGNRAAVRNHDLDLGLGYGRSFSLSSRTAFTFSSGSSVVSSDGERHLVLTGSAALRRQLARRWSANLSYDRGVQVLENVPRPFTTGTLSGLVSGHFSSRVNLKFQPGYTLATDVADSRQRYHSYTSFTRLEAALAHNWAAYVEHFYYQYTFTGVSNVPAALAAGLDRQGVRVGLSLWAPLLR